MKKCLYILILTLPIYIGVVDPACGQSTRRTSGSSVHTPSPRLIAPTSEVVDIRGKDGILFKWSSHEIPSGGRRKYRFQLYEGYDMYEKNLIFKKEFPPDIFEIFIEKDKFKDGEAYTWSVCQRGYFANWSWRSFYSFKVVK